MKPWMLSEARHVRANLHLPDAQIGADLGRSRRSVERFRARMGIEKGREWAPDFAKRMWAERREAAR